MIDWATARRIENLEVATRPELGFEALGLKRGFEAAGDLVTDRPPHLVEFTVDASEAATSNESPSDGSPKHSKATSFTALNSAIRQLCSRGVLHNGRPHPRAFLRNQPHLGAVRVLGGPQDQEDPDRARP